jgi:hypothetical protein
MPYQAGLSDHIFGIFDALAATFFIFLIRSIVKKSGIEKKWSKIIYPVLVFLIILFGYIPFLFIVYSKPETIKLSTATAAIAMLTPLFQILLSILVIRMLQARLSLAVGKKQYGEPFELTVRKFRGKKYLIKARRLFSDLAIDDMLYLNWDTFGDGIEVLLKQLKSYSPSIRPDLIVGINNAGMIIGSYLAGSYTDGDKRLGYIKTGGEGHEILDLSLPPKRKGNTVRSIILTDCEVKSGNSLCNAVAYLKQLYGENVDIKIAVMVACMVTGRINEIIDLANSEKGVFSENPDYLPDFLSYVCKCRVEPPGEIY